MRISTSMRLALAFAAVWLLATGAILATIWWQTSDYLDRSIDRVISTDVQGLSDLYRSDGLAGLLDTIRARVLRRAPADAYYAILDPQGRRLVGNLDAEVAHAVPAGWSTRELPRISSRVTARIYASPVPEGFGIIVGRDITDRAALRSSLLEALATAAILSLAVAILASLAFNWLIRNRLERVAATARGIVAGDLSARVTVDGSGDAFDNLAGTLNAMLDRTEQLMDGMRQVSNDIAHDLRTPLAVLRSRLERLVDSAGAAAREGLQDAINHTDEILRIFEALLRIAAIDARTHRSAFADVDLSDVARNVAEIYEPLAEENDRKIVLEIGPDVHVHADRQLLAQALANLVDNALKHGAGPVTISLAREAATIRLTVSDRGPGVPPEERKRVLDRFYRGDRARATSGSGLGLALAASVVRLHGGTIELDDNAPGLRVEIVLPSDGVAPSLAPAIKSVVRT